MKVIFAGDRDISVWVLKHILDTGVRPLALLLSDAERASHAQELRELCAHLNNETVLIGTEFRGQHGLRLLDSLRPDFILCIHFPFIIPKAVLSLPKHGVINLHPAYLPYNRGWHTPSWALLEQTPIGATLHFMDEGLDTGDIIHQRQLFPKPSDTADTLYADLKRLEYEVFCEAWPSLLDGSYKRHPQPSHSGSIHKRADLFQTEVQEIQLDIPVNPRSLLTKLRALTTSDISEAAYFEENGKVYRVQVRILEE